ncbi:SRPBCC family protein [Nonomuraea sp. NPDC003707]
MFEFTESILIEASPPAVWEVLRDIDGWWPASNFEHESLERLDDRGIQAGARIRIREKIAGIPGEAIGEITRIEPLSEVTWEAPHARYRWHGIPITIGEGVTWRIEPREGDTVHLSAHVWATFPSGRLGRFLEWFFTHPLGGVEKDREHTRVELHYLKEVIEGDVK